MHRPLGGSGASVASLRPTRLGPPASRPSCDTVQPVPRHYRQPMTAGEASDRLITTAQSQSFPPITTSSKWSQSCVPKIAISLHHASAQKMWTVGHALGGEEIVTHLTARGKERSRPISLSLSLRPCVRVRFVSTPTWDPGKEDSYVRVVGFILICSGGLCGVKFVRKKSQGLVSCVCVCVCLRVFVCVCVIAFWSVEDVHSIYERYVSEVDSSRP